jgi:peptidoglycan/LPS O-acetylase OafA/YrhL
MITATVLVLLFAPLFYVLIERIFGKRQKRASDGTEDKSSFFTALKEKIFGKRQNRKSVESEKANPSEVK